jgi:hypothetical protein
MAGTAKDITLSEILQGPGDLWAVTTAPVDATPRLILASDGTPDATTHGASVHMGAMAEAITTQVKPKLDALQVDTFDGPVAYYATDLEAKIEATLAQVTLSLLQRALGVGTYSAGSGYKQVVFGGTDVVPETCIAAISRKRTNAARHVVSLLYKAVATGGFQIALGRSKASQLKIAFQGLADPSRTVGRQVGIVFETLADAAGGTVTAKATAVADIQQGPCDLWLVSPAPVDGTARVTLAADLTPDSSAHAASKHLGAPSGETTITVQPKIEWIRIDQCDAPVGAYLSGLETSIEAEMTQAEVLKLSRALGVGSYSTDDATYKQVTFGGGGTPEEFCIAAISPKRSAPTKALCGALFRVSSTEGLQIGMSRSKPGLYKVKFSGMVDAARTAGKQMGVVFETV